MQTHGLQSRYTCDAWSALDAEVGCTRPTKKNLHVDEGTVAEAQLDGLQQLRQQLVVRFATDPRVPRTHVERAAQQLLAICACVCPCRCRFRREYTMVCCPPLILDRNDHLGQGGFQPSHYASSQASNAMAADLMLQLP